MEAVAGGGGGAGYAPSPGGDGGNPGGDGGNSEEGLQLGTGGLGGGDGTGGFGGESEKGKFHGSTGADYAGNASSTGIFSPDSADGNGGDGDTNGDGGGGGGGGYGGGGGGCIGGGGGGGCYGQIIIGGANGVAGDNSDPNYIASAGNSTSADGEDGLVVLIFGNPANVTVPAKISANSFAGDGSSLTNIQLINVVSALPSNAVYHLTGNVSGGFAQSPLFIENTDTNTSCGPALRLQADGSATPDGALSVSSQNNDSSSIIARFGNASAFVCTISNNGSISARGTIYVNGVALTSDRDAKENFVPVDSATLLDRVAALPISEWNYKTDPADKRHLGPMAQDFQAAFGLDGNDNKHISLVDEGGIALAAIQGLNQKVDEKDALIQKQAAEIADLKARLEKLEKLIK
ncbi:MAG TPA: tail fiber domain-containing protein [Verrucomicrobiae bacterium]